jgi:hypothetical protein
MGRKRNDGLTAQQAKALAVLVEGGTHQAAAAASGVSRRSIWRWRQSGPFKEALDEIRCSTVEEIKGKALRLADSMLDDLTLLAKDPKTPPAVRAQILTQVVKVAELDKTPAPSASGAPDLAEWIGQHEDLED